MSEGIDKLGPFKRMPRPQAPQGETRVPNLNTLLPYQDVVNLAEKNKPLDELDTDIAKGELRGVKGVDQYLKSLAAFTEASLRIETDPKAAKLAAEKLNRYKDQLAGEPKDKKDFCQTRIRDLKLDVEKEKNKPTINQEELDSKTNQLRGWEQLLGDVESETP